MHKND
jgi:hypothetical protein